MTPAYGADRRTLTPTAHITRGHTRRAGRAGSQPSEYLPQRRSHGSGPEYAEVLHGQRRPTRHPTPLPRSTGQQGPAGPRRGAGGDPDHRPDAGEHLREEGALPRRLPLLLLVPVPLGLPLLRVHVRGVRRRPQGPPAPTDEPRR